MRTIEVVGLFAGFCFILYLNTEYVYLVKWFKWFLYVTPHCIDNILWAFPFLRRQTLDHEEVSLMGCTWIGSV